MPRFQLLVREPGQSPRVVPLGDPLVVGRSSSVDLTVADEEVGRRQFRIGVTSGFVVLEGLGTTNPTRIDEVLLAAGEKRTVDAGSTIRVGKTSFVVERIDATVPPPAGPIDATMVARGPVAPPTAAPPGAGAPDDVPEHTMEMPRPGAPGAKAPPRAALEETAAGPGPAAAGTPPTEEIGRTMAKGFRPGAFGAPPPATPPPAAPKQPTPPPPAPRNDTDYGQTMAKGFRPGALGGDAPTPAPAAKPSPAPAPPAPTPAPKPTPTPPPPVTAAPAAAATPAAAADARPKTVAVRPEDMPPMVPPAGDDVESRLHRSMPRLFVKSGGLKRPVRLMKAVNRIGRAETADVLLPHESVSELHAELCFDGQRWVLRDKGSTNGCIVDGRELRSAEAPVQRNSLLGIGALQLVFLCVDPETAAAERRAEQRALKALARMGRITRDEARQVLALTRSDPSQSIPEILLKETAIAPVDWAHAVAEARRRVPLLERLLQLFSRRPAAPAPR